MSFYNEFLEDEYEAGLRAEDEREQKIQDIIRDYGCSEGIAEYMVNNNCTIDEAEDTLNEDEN